MFNRKLKRQIADLKDTVEFLDKRMEYDRQMRYDLERRFARLLYLLQIEEVTVPSTPEVKLFQFKKGKK